MIILVIIFSFVSIVEHINYYFQYTSFAFIGNETYTANDFSVDKEPVIKIIRGAFTDMSSLLHNVILFLSIFEDFVKITTDPKIPFPVINDPILDIDQVAERGITETHFRRSANTYGFSYFENYSHDLGEGHIYKISKSANIKEKGTLGNIGWINLDTASLSISIERNEPVSGSASLRVDVHPAAVGDERVNASWSGITSDFIPIKNHTNYNYGLDISSEDVDQLHSIVSYYNSSKNQIKEHYIFGGNDGTFKKEFNNTFLSPIDAKYAKVQLWLRPNIGKPSSYLVDNIRITETFR